MDAGDRRKMLLLGLLSILNGLFNVVGIASILPFIGLISAPEALDTNKYILVFKEFTGIDSYAGVVIAFGTISLLMVVIGNAVSAFEAFYGEIFGHKKERELSEKLLRNYLMTDVREFEKMKVGERAKSILSDVDRVILDSLFAMFQLVSGIIVSLFIIGLLLIVDWRVTVVVTTVLFSIYFLIHQFTSVRLDRLGQEYSDLESDLYNNVLEALKFHKEIKLNSFSGFFVRRYSRSCGQMVRNRLRHSMISLVPQYAVELVAYGVILMISMYFAVFSRGEGSPITLIGMYAFAAYRLIPAIEVIFDCMEGILFGSAILEDFVKAFDDPAAFDESGAEVAPQHSIALSDVSFRFSSEGAFVLERLNLEFPVGGLTCIKGKTGCGKSTVLNLVSGLYRPSSGRVCGDGKPFDAYACRQWKNRIGLVPATVNLMHASLYENIALGVPLEEIDQQKVREVSALVDLDEHIMKLRDGYASVYGEDGLCFSSGQILKVGLARALYRDPALLLMDESTDALDIETERLVLTRLKEIPSLTIIFISHRESVLPHASKIINLEAELLKTDG
jgi:ABC-type bacteriocin/lantibiotic exporter with double-glycine peptidase domain